MPALGLVPTRTDRSRPPRSGGLCGCGGVRLGVQGYGCRTIRPGRQLSWSLTLGAGLPVRDEGDGSCYVPGSDERGRFLFRPPRWGHHARVRPGAHPDGSFSASLVGWVVWVRWGAARGSGIRLSNDPSGPAPFVVARSGCRLACSGRKGTVPVTSQVLGRGGPVGSFSAWVIGWVVWVRWGAARGSGTRLSNDLSGLPPGLDGRGKAPGIRRGRRLGSRLTGWSSTSICFSPPR